MSLPYAISLPYNGAKVGIVISNVCNMLPHRDNPNRTIIHIVGGGFVFADMPVAEIVELINDTLDGDDL
jgi:hypothetical protein